MSSSNRNSLQNKVALVLGGSRGIGAAIVERLATEGAAVAFTFVSSAQKAEALAAGLRATVKTYGRLDILVNSAGVLAIGPLEDFSMADFDLTLAVNVRSVFIAIQEAARHMGEGGRIITIGSTDAERMPFAGGGVSAMSKAAIVGLTRGLARDLGPRGITINNVQPGPGDTGMNPDNGEFAATLKGLMALPRYGRPEEIASFVAYLAGPEAGYITGASLTIDGGFSA